MACGKTDQIERRKIKGTWEEQGSSPLENTYSLIHSGEKNPLWRIPNLGERPTLGNAPYSGGLLPHSMEPLHSGKPLSLESPTL